jgi:signal transduction histidine kinase
LATNYFFCDKPVNSSITKYRPLFVLAPGFALVIGLLALMAWLGLRQANSINANATELLNGHLQMARLVDQLEREHQRATAMLLFTARLPNESSRQRIQSELTIFDAALPPLISEGLRVLPKYDWKQLNAAANAFTQSIRQRQAGNSINEAEVVQLEKRHDELAFLMTQIIKDDATRSIEIENRIAENSKELLGETAWLLGICLFVALICAGLTMVITLRSVRRLTEQSLELNRVSWHLIQGQEAAARRFSHEIHDELGQALAGLKATLQSVTVGTLDSRRLDCLHTLDEAIGNVRELSQLLRPVILDDFGLEAAIRWLSERFQERTRILVHFDADFHGRLADDVETHLFRISQEALTNVARHAGATHVHISLQSNEPDLTLSIADNGIGLQQKKGMSLGLIGMRARAEQLQGKLVLTKGKLGGVCVAVTVPARPPVEQSVIEI